MCTSFTHTYLCTCPILCVCVHKLIVNVCLYVHTAAAEAYDAVVVLTEGEEQNQPVYTKYIQMHVVYCELQRRHTMRWSC